MSWHIILTGDLAILDSLSIEKDSNITRNDTDYVLNLKEFDNIVSVDTVKELASEYLDTLNGLLYLQDVIPSAIKIHSIFKINPDGTRNIFLSPEPGVFHLRGYAPTITITHSSGEHSKITPYQNVLLALQNSKSQEKIRAVLKAIKNGDFDFPALYKILDILFSLKGRKLYEWVPESKIDFLKRSSQQYRHGVNRHPPPKAPMSLEEAQKITRYLIEKCVTELV